MKTAAEARPYHGRLTLKLMPEESKSVIIDPEADGKERPQVGEVVAIGKRLPGQEPFAEVGMLVKYGKYAGVLVNYTDGEFLSIAEAELLSEA